MHQSVSCCSVIIHELGEIKDKIRRSNAAHRYLLPTMKSRLMKVHIKLLKNASLY